jgi:drug/metabolite transporter (DMT)-like permease
LTSPEAVLVVTTVIWGPTYLIMQRALLLAGPMYLIGTRFAVAAAALILLLPASLAGLTRREAVAGASIGVSVAFSYAFLALGLKTIPSSEAAILSALYVPLVPLLQWLFLRRPPSLFAWFGTALALGGLVLIAGPDSTSWGLGPGELLIIISALATAVEVILISGFSSWGDARRITTVQLGVASAVGLFASFALGEIMPAFSWPLALIVIGLGLSSAGIQLAMNWAQKTVSPTRATLIYTAEPVWAALVGRLFGERLPAATFAGAALILAGIVVGEIKSRRALAWPRR